MVLPPRVHTDEAKAAQAELQGSISSSKGVLSELRGRLYARLGDSINLDVPAR
jgi:hypothetical protein